MSFIKCSNTVSKKLLTSDHCHPKTNTLKVLLPEWVKTSMKFIYDCGLDVISFRASGFYADSGLFETESVELEIRDPKNSKVVNATLKKNKPMIEKLCKKS